MTNPDVRNDPWQEALTCYEDYSDELIIVGEDWPQEFKFDLIGKYFQEGFDKCSGDWVFRMDIDYFFHEKNIEKLKFVLKKYSDYPAISFPQYQFFTPDRYQIKTRLCIALNKKNFPSIKLNGGGDLCLPTLDNNLIDFRKMPNVNIPIYQYDSMFRTKEIISLDRARFARAWFNYFGNYGDRGGSSSTEAFEAWFAMIQKKYLHHTHKISFEKHPIYIKNLIKNLNETQFGFDAFGLKNKTKRPIKNYLKGYKEKYVNPFFFSLF